MMRKRLLAEEENQELVNKYGDNVLFKSLSVIGLQCSGMAKNFALSKSELFYHVLFSLDEIRGYEDKNERIDYCKSLWNDIYEYLSCKVDAEETDLRNAASLVTLAVCNCINISGLLIYHDEVCALLKSNAKGNPDALKLCFSWFQDFQNSVKNQKIRQWLKEYFEGDSFLSDEISQELEVPAEDSNKSIPSGLDVVQLEIINKVDHFNEVVKVYSFYECPKVKCLNKKQRSLLVDKIVNRKDALGAYAIAMLCFLEYDKWIQEQFAKANPHSKSISKENLFKHITDALSLTNERNTKGNYNIIRRENCTEDREKYKSWSFEKQVQEDYEAIKKA